MDLTSEEWISQAQESLVSEQDPQKILQILKTVAHQSFPCSVWAYFETRKPLYGSNGDKLWRMIDLSTQKIFEMINHWMATGCPDSLIFRTPTTLALAPKKSLYYQCRNALPELMKEAAGFLPSAMPPFAPSPMSANLRLPMPENTQMPKTISPDVFGEQLQKLRTTPVIQGEYLLYWLEKIPRQVFAGYVTHITAHIERVALYIIAPLVTELAVVSMATRATAKTSEKTEWTESYIQLFATLASSPFYICTLKGKLASLLDSVEKVCKDKTVAKSALFQFAEKALVSISSGIHIRNAGLKCTDSSQLLEFGVLYEMFAMALPTDTKEAARSITKILTELIEIECKNISTSAGCMAYAINVLLCVLEFLARNREEAIPSLSVESKMFESLRSLAHASVMPYKYDYYLHMNILTVYSCLQTTDVDSREFVQKVFDDSMWQESCGPSGPGLKYKANIFVHEVLYCSKKKTLLWNRMDMLDILINQARQLKNRDLMCFLMVMTSSASKEDDDGCNHVRQWAAGVGEFQFVGQSISQDILQKIPVSMVSTSLLREMGVEVPGDVLVDHENLEIRQLLTAGTFMDYFVAVEGGVV